MARYDHNYIAVLGEQCEHESWGEVTEDSEETGEFEVNEVWA